VLVLLMRGDLWRTLFRRPLVERLYVPSFMTIDTSVKEILRLWLRNLRGCNIDNTDGRVVWCTPLRWLHLAWYTRQVSWRLVQACKQFKVFFFASVIWGVVMLVLLMKGISCVRLEMSSSVMIYVPSFVETDSAVQKLIGGNAYRHTDSNMVT
jgi:hypothetical protein